MRIRGRAIAEGGFRASRRELQAVRKEAETLRRALKAYVRRGGSYASLVPKVHRAHRLVRRGDLEGALRVLRSLGKQVRQRLSADDT